MKMLTIGTNGLRRLLRDRTGAFVALILPFMLILLLGILLDTAGPRIGVVVAGDGPLAGELAASIATIENADVADYPDRTAVLDAVVRFDRDVGVVIPEGYDEMLAAGSDVRVEYIVESAETDFYYQDLIRAEIAEQSAAVAAARFAGETLGLGFEEGLDAAAQAATVVGGVEVVTAGPGGEELEEVTAFEEYGAKMLLLFVFLTSLSTGAQQLVRSRTLGISRRMLTTPTPGGTIVVGETAGRFIVALTQSLVVVIVAALVFGVDWGNWAATSATLLLFAVVAAGAGILLGSVMRNDQTALALGIFLALAMGMLGGLMGDGAGITEFVPHTWANAAFNKIMSQGAGIADIATELGVLAGFALGFIGLAALAFRRSTLRART